MLGFTPVWQEFSTELGFASLHYGNRTKVDNLGFGRNRRESFRVSIQTVQFLVS